MDLLRRLGVALGSLVAAALSVGVVGSVLFGSAALQSVLYWPIVVVLGGLIYFQIIRRDLRR